MQHAAYFTVQLSLISPFCKLLRLSVCERRARGASMRVRLCALLALVSADGPKIPCHSGLENDLEFAACSDYCTESHHCTKCKCRCPPARLFVTNMYMSRARDLPAVVPHSQ